MTPVVINCFYFCDPDGHIEYVRSKEALPVDERTPQIRSLVFKNIEAKNCHVAGAFFYGQTKKKIQKVVMEHVHITYDENRSQELRPCLTELSHVQK